MGHPYDEKVQRFLQNLSYVPEDVAVIGLILGSLGSASALLGNILIIMTFLTDRHLRQRQNVFVVSAAIMEIILTFLKDAIALGVYGVGRWQFGVTMMNGKCDITPFL
ncbi:hypothetical protein LSH36_1664g00007 [Paralvinella palmiformis]|uniref:G-protein coupled receptors family 1 profile domain-containing protein n=1 Tax=Paralvinella palmiformis TaxID=53620 RepID=A0AAD9IRI3_9ANNE|nr:hypothetical protein LSH36_1664g00007 [Paralvinella palmiformis]